MKLFRIKPRLGVMMKDLCQFPNVAFSKQLPEENEPHYIMIKNNLFFTIISYKNVSK